MDVGSGGQNCVIVFQGDKEIEFMGGKVQVVFKGVYLCWQVDFFFQLFEVGGIDVSVDVFFMQGIEEVLNVWDVFFFENFVVNDYLYFLE